MIFYLNHFPDNGFCYCKGDIRSYIRNVYKDFGLEINDYNIREILKELNEDKDFETIAFNNYTPLPMYDNQDVNCKEMYLKRVEEKSYAGYGEVPDYLVYRKVNAILKRIADVVVPPRREAEKRAKYKYNLIMSKIESVETKSKITTDEGGKTIIYYHTVKLKSGTILKFLDRNIFDYGRVINPLYEIADGIEGGLINIIDGEYWWEDFTKGKGWEPVRLLTQDEVDAYNALSYYYGHANSYIRM